MALSIYGATTALFTPATAATDIFSISGSATKTVKVMGLNLHGTQTTGGNIGTIGIIKRSSANTGGTAVASTRVPLDSSSAAATSTVQHYTANPTLGGTIGTIYQPRVVIPAAANITPPAPVLVWDPSLSLWYTTVVLRGTAEVLVVNMGGGALPAGATNFTVSVVWSEE